MDFFFYNPCSLFPPTVSIIKSNVYNIMKYTKTKTIIKIIKNTMHTGYTPVAAHAHVQEDKVKMYCVH